MNTCVFRPRDGAILDLVGLEAIGDVPNQLLHTHLSLIAPQSVHLILTGLEPDGQRPKKMGPPGIMRFGPDRLSISPGVAILPDETGRRHVLRVHEPIEMTTGEPEVATELRFLVLRLNGETQSNDVGDNLAREMWRAEVFFLPQSELEGDHILPLAQELAPKIWATDLCRLLAPNHPAIVLLNAHFDELEELIWTSEAHGKVHKIHKWGREWQTYQTRASVAVTATRMALAGRPTTSQDRARVLAHLYWQLQRSVEKAAVMLEKWVGTAENASVYAEVFTPFPKEWDDR